MKCLSKVIDPDYLRCKLTVCQGNGKKIDIQSEVKNDLIHLCHQCTQSSPFHILCYAYAI